MIHSLSLGPLFRTYFDYGMKTIKNTSPLSNAYTGEKKMAAKLYDSDNRVQSYIKMIQEIDLFTPIDFILGEKNLSFRNVYILLNQMRIKLNLQPFLKNPKNSSPKLSYIFWNLQYIPYL